MFMISLTILFSLWYESLHGWACQKTSFVAEIRYARYISQLLSDLWAYYSSPYPLLLIGGVLRRIIRRANTLWQAKGRGRPSISEMWLNWFLTWNGQTGLGVRCAFLKNYFYLASMYTRRPSNGYYLKMAWSRQKLALHLRLGLPSSMPIRIFGP